MRGVLTPGTARRLVGIAVTMVLLGTVALAADDPWYEPPIKSRLSPAQKKRITAGKKEKKLVRSYFGNDISEAVRLARQVLKRDLDVFSENHEETAKTAHLLSDALWRASEHQQAIDLWKAEAGVYSKRFGENNWRVISSLARLRVLERVAKLSSDARRNYGTGWEDIDACWNLFDRGEAAQGQARAERAAARFQQTFERIGLPFAASLEYGSCLSAMTRAQIDLGRFAKAEEYARERLTVTGRVYGRIHPHYADAMSQLAQVHRRKGELSQAEFAEREALSIFEQCYDYPNRSLVHQYMVLGRTYSDGGKYALAETAYLKGLELYKQSSEPYPTSYTAGLLGLGNVYRATGRLVEAEEKLTENLKFAEKRNGKDSVSYGVALNDLAHVLVEKKEYKEALKNYTLAGQIQAKHYNRKHPEYAVTLIGQGRCQTQLKQYKKAESLFTESIGILRKKLGNSHTHTRNAHDRICELHDTVAERRIEQGKFDEARTAIEKKIAELVTMYGENDWRIISSRRFLEYVTALEMLPEEEREKLTASRKQLEEARALQRAGKPEEAEPILREVLEITNAKLGEDSAETAQVQLMLAQVLHQRSQIVDAEKLFRAAGRTYEKHWPVLHWPPAHGEVRLRLAEYARRRGETAEALRLCDGARDLLRRRVGAGNYLYREALQLSARLRQDTGDLLGAEVLFRELLASRERYDGQRTLAYAEAAEDLATVLRQLGKSEESERLYRMALEIAKPDESGKSWPNIRIRNQLGLLYRELGKRAMAAAAFQQCLDEYSRHFAAEDNNATIYLNNLAAVQFENGDLGQAEPNLRKVLALFAAQRNPSLERALSRLVQILEERGQSLAAEGKDEPARAAFAEAAELCQKHLGQKHWRTTQTQARLREFEIVLKLSTDDRKQMRNADAAVVESSEKLREGQLAEALAAAERAVQARAAVFGSNQRLTPSADLARVAVLRERLGRNVDAARAWTDAIAARSAALDAEHPEVGALHRGAGELALRSEDLTQALTHFAQAGKCYAKSLGLRSPEYGAVLARFAQARTRQGELAAAGSLARQAVDILRPSQGEKLDDYLLAQHGLAEWQLATGDIWSAHAILGQTRGVIDRHLPAVHPAQADNLLLRVEWQRLQSRPEAPPPPGPQPPLANPTQVEKDALEASRRTYGANSTATAAALTLVARAVAERTGSKNALPLLGEAARIFRSALGDTHPALASVLQQYGVARGLAGDHDDAEKLLQAALALRQRQGEAGQAFLGDLFRDLGDLMLRRDDSARAAGFYRQFLDHSRAQLDRASLSQTERQLILLTRQFRGALDRILSLPFKPEDAESLYGYVLAWKSAAFARGDLIRAARGQKELEPLFGRWERLSVQLATQASTVPYPEEQTLWQQRVEQLARERDQVEVELLRRAHAGKLPLATRAEEVRAVLPADAVLVDLIEYQRLKPISNANIAWARSPHLAAFVMRKGQPIRRIELGSAGEIATFVQEWREDCTQWLDRIAASRNARTEEDRKRAIEDLERSLKRLETNDTNLRRRIWDPLSETLRRASTLLIAPDGNLNLYPFSALETRPGNRLVEEMGVVIVPAPSILPRMLAKPTNPRSGPPSLLALGDVNYQAAPERIADRPAWVYEGKGFVGSRALPRGSVTALKATEPQVNAIAASFAAAAPDAPLHKLLDRQATENAFRRLAPDSRWIYLTTHGFQDTELLGQAVQRVRQFSGVTLGESVQAPTPAALRDPGLASGLTFAGANEANDVDEDDGVLWSMEIAAMNLTGVELAVLTACQTAEGALNSGEGVMSVQRAFHTAGARSVVSTTWSVQVDASLLLMERFMRNIIEKKLPRAEALREAQAWMIASARATQPNEKVAGYNYQSSKLPKLYGLPYYWSGFVLSGDWR